MDFIFDSPLRRLLLVPLCVVGFATGVFAEEKVVVDWMFNSGFGEVLGKNAGLYKGTAIGAKGAKLASKTKGDSEGKLAWQFNDIPDGSPGGIETVLEDELPEFELQICYKPAEESVPVHTQYLAGIGKKMFVRITEANRLEAGLCKADDTWEELGFALAEIRPLNQWTEVKVRYLGNQFFLIVNGEVKGSKSVENFRLNGGERLVVAACPWEPLIDHYAGAMGSLKLVQIEK